MKVRVRSIYNCQASALWSEVKKVSSLMKVSAPLLSFKTDNESTLSKTWNVGDEYCFHLYAFGLIPIGKHFIRVLEMDDSTTFLRTEEFGGAIKVWNHYILIKSLDDEQISYQDEIEIKAGIFTFPVWIAATIFYLHRQQKWKRIIKSFN